MGHHHRPALNSNSLIRTLETSDYTCIVLFGVSFLTIANWFLYAKRHYHGPSISLLVGTTNAEDQTEH